MGWKTMKLLFEPQGKQGSVVNCVDADVRLHPKAQYR